MRPKITASIVLYKSDPDILARSIRSFLLGLPDSVLYLIDNSPAPFESEILKHPQIIYHHNGENIGFGNGHNLAMKQSLDQGADYHVVLNPDVYFGAGVITKLASFMDSEPHVGLVMPKVLYPDGRVQHVCKLLPTPSILFMRHFFRFNHELVRKKNLAYELQFSGYNKLMDVPFLSGCFMFLRNDALRKVGLFDENIFLYTEDIDLTRRIHKHFRTVFYPDVSIHHVHQRGSYKNFRAFLHHIRSAIFYFNKWGWFNDPERDTINRNILLKLSE